ncbi:MAG: dihydroneopterin aldolase [Bacteroidota bacterium]
MSSCIRIKNAHFYAYHGALEEEQNIGGKFEIDVDMETDFSEAAKTDELHLTVNYHEVYKFIDKVVHGEKFYLIETLASRIAEGLLQKFEEINKLTIRVRKRNVPVGGMLDYVEAEIVKTRDE